MTTQRVVFAGTRKTVEVLYARLISLDLYEDGICFHISGRQESLLLRTVSTTLMANLVNGVIHGDFEVMNEATMVCGTAKAILKEFQKNPSPRTLDEIGVVEHDEPLDDPYSPESMQFQKEHGITPEEYFRITHDSDVENEAAWREQVAAAVDLLVSQGLLTKTGDLYSPPPGTKAE